MSDSNNIYNQDLSGVNLPATGYLGFRKTLLIDANLDDTLLNAKRIAIRDAGQVKELANKLKGNSIYETAENIWDYLRANTVYKLDKSGIEELRTPARSLVDGKKGFTDTNYGIDCDDYTILVSALLINLEINHEYRVASYSQKGKFQHIYPVAFDESGEPLIIDIVPEIPHFNYEAKPIIDLKIIPMELHELSGVDDLEIDVEQEAKQDLIEALNEPFSLSGIEEDEDEDDLLETHFLSGLSEVDSEEQADIVLNGSDVSELLERGILAEVNKAKTLLIKEQSTPTILSQTINVAKELELVSEVMSAWGNEDERDEVLAEAIGESKSYKNFFRSIQMSLDELENDHLNGLDDEPIYLAKVSANDDDLAEILDDSEDDEIDGIGRRRRKRGRFKRFFKKVGKGIKKVVKAVVRYNPATIAMRGATLLVLKLDMFKIASKLIYAYLTPQQAQARKMDMGEWKKLVNIRNKGLRFYTRIGGKSSKFKRAIIKGRAAKKTGLQLNGEIGVVVTAAAGATTASASGFLALMKRLFRKLNPAKLFKKVQETIKKSKSNTTSPSVNVPSAFRSDAPALRSMEQTEKTGFIQKVKTFFVTHKKKIIIVGVGGVVALVVVMVLSKIKEKRKRSLSGLKGARTRKRNSKQLPAKRRTYSRKPVGKGSTTIIRVPSKSIKKSRVSTRSNANRLRAMHTKAKQLRKKHPSTKYSQLLKKASKLI
jgi:hypothetical protein